MARSRKPKPPRAWRGPVLAVGALTLVTAGLLWFARWQSPEARWHRAYEAARAEGAGPGTTSPYIPFQGGLATDGPADWRAVQGQLVEYSRRSYPVIVGQTGNWGQAHASGHIVLDLSTLREPKDILAFKLAHEWAHLALGHGAGAHASQSAVPDATEADLTEAPKNGDTEAAALDQPGQTHRSAPTDGPTGLEDAADAWAGAFLAAYGYDVEAVAAYLRRLPYDPSDTGHSAGDRRADIVLGAAGADPTGHDDDKD